MKKMAWQIGKLLLLIFVVFVFVVKPAFAKVKDRNADKEADKSNYSGTVKIGANIPLHSNAFGVLWNLSVSVISYNDESWLVSPVGLYFEYGEGRAATRTRDDDRFHFGLYEGYNYVRDNRIYGGFDEVRIKYLYLGYLTAFSVKLDVPLVMSVNGYAALGPEIEMYSAKLHDEEGIKSIGETYNLLAFAMGTGVALDIFEILGRKISFEPSVSVRLPMRFIKDEQMIMAVLLNLQLGVR